MRAGRIDLNGSAWQVKGYLGEDWRLRRAFHPETRDRRLWIPAQVPGSVMHDLLIAGEIPDPTFERNSRFAEWAPARTWVYRRTFTVPAGLRGRRIQLVCEGVDYSAEFYLNGELLGAHEGMFTPARFEVGERLIYGAENQLSVAVLPAPDEEPQVGSTSRVRTHKTRMNYGWDFCPRLVHQGIWQPVYLQVSGPCRIHNVFIQPRLNADCSSAEIVAEVQLDSPESGQGQLELVVRTPTGDIRQCREKVSFPAGVSKHVISMGVQSPELWWPNGSGDQPLYSAEMTLSTDLEELSDSSTCRFGIRQAELAPNEGSREGALQYTLVVNGRRIMINGWNWVPLDVFYGVERPQKLDRLLRLAAEAGVNLLRVWGGGLIEKEGFYERCDRHGIFIWQEFIQSSSGVDNTPSADPGFVQKMAAEAREIIPLRRNHPSLLVWCGGNELMSAPEVPLDERHPVLAELRAAVHELDPGRPWLPASPSGPCFSNSLAARERSPDGLHDVHGPWEHQGLVGQARLYNQGACLLHSEFGVEGITNQPVLDRVIAPEHQWPVSLSNPNWQHLGAWWLKEATLTAAFGEISSAAEAQRAAQFLQFDGLRYAVEADRRRMYRCSGTLPWQFNEPFPMAASTSAVDYYGQPKPAYVAVAAAYEPVHVSARFDRQSWANCPGFEAEAWLTVTRQDERNAGRLTARVVGISGREYLKAYFPIEQLAEGSSRVGWVSLKREEFSESFFFLDLTLSGERGEAVSRNRYLFTWEESFARLLNPPPVRIQAGLRKNGRRWSVLLENDSTLTAFYLWLADSRPPGACGFAWIDPNYLCLLPGESRLFKATWEGVPAPDRRLVVKGWNTNVIHMG